MLRWPAGGRTRLAYLAALLLLAAVRLAPIVAANFPLGDGGLLTVMARDLRANGFALPAFTSYNDGSIPFVYPPLGAYILALIPGDPIQTERWLPLLYSLIAAGAAWLLAAELAGRRIAAVALLAFVSMPVTWAIEGGGVTRGLGFALLLFALWRAAVLLRSPTVRNAALAGVPFGLALLSHPSVGPTGVASAILFLAFRPSWRGALLLTAGAGLAALIVLPWLLTVLAVHGPEPLLLGIGAHAQQPALVRLLTFGPSWLGPLDPILPASIIGAAVAIRREGWLVPAWLALLVVVPGGDGRFAALAWAILAGYGAAFTFEALRSIQAERWAAVMGVAVLLVASWIASYQLFQPVSADTRAAMLSGPITPTEEDDPAVEWYPALTGRASAIVYFGYEWTTTWGERLGAYERALRACGCS